MARVDYTSIDASILLHISEGNNTFTLIHAREVRKLAESLSTFDAFRVTDRRLQALRRAGRIAFKAGHWSLKDAA